MFRRLIAAVTALLLLAMCFGGMMRDRCLMGASCCPPPELAFVNTDSCPDCMAPGGPKLADSEASRKEETSPVFVVVAPMAALGFANRGSRALIRPARVREVPSPQSPQIRVLRI